MSGAASGNVSIPVATTAPRSLTEDERATLGRVANTLIPARGGAPAAAAEPGFWDGLALAVDARADAFHDITGTLRALALIAPDQMWVGLQALEVEQPQTFQALSTVIAGAWLLTPGTRDRIGYHGQQSDRAGLEEAADEITSGVLDPVLERDAAAEGPRWIR